MKKKNTGKLLIESLTEALDYHQGKVTLRTEQVTIPNPPPEFSSKQIKQIRNTLKVSQPIFARYLGVSDNAVKSWEQGGGNPTGSAARLLQIAQKDPAAFQKLVLNTTKPPRSYKKAI